MSSARQLFIVTAAMELGAGLTLLVAPAVIISLLFGSAVGTFPAAGVARLTGGALFALGAACWWARHDGASAAARALVGGLLVYNTAVVTLATVGTLGGPGPLQWAALAMHAAQAIWCVWVLTHHSESDDRRWPKRSATG